jgi:hypothetical protein
MAASPKKSAKTKKPVGLADIELHHDAWKRFENFVDANVRTRAAPTKKPTASRPKATSRKRAKKA